MKLRQEGKPFSKDFCQEDSIASFCHTTIRWANFTPEIEVFFYFFPLIISLLIDVPFFMGGVMFISKNQYGSNVFLNHRLAVLTVFHESLCSRRTAVAPRSPQSVRRYLQSAYSGELTWPPPQLHCRHSSSEEGRKEGSHRYENIIRARASAPALPKQILHIQRNTHTFGICLGERSATDQPQSFWLPPPLRLSSFCRAAVVKPHQHVGFGDFLIKTVQANQYEKTFVQRVTEHYPITVTMEMVFFSVLKLLHHRAK